eukprot:Em0015g5a
MATVLRQCITAVRCLKFHKPAKTVLNSFVPAVSIFRSGSSSGAVSKASSRLLQCLNEEIRLEKKVPDNLPAVGKFDIQIKGSLATLVQNHGQEKIQVQLDANSAIEVMQDDDMEDGGEPLFVPTFTVTVSKPGTSVQFDCSFDESGSYEEGSEWEYMHIDSITVLPDDNATMEHIYSAEAENLNEWITLRSVA